MTTRQGERQQFATLLPASGDAFLRVQDTDTGVPGCHLDLHVEDLSGAADEARAAGADLVAALDELTPVVTL